MKPIVLVDLIFALHVCVYVVSAQPQINARDGVTPAARLGTVTFPLEIGDRWFYSYSSAINGKGSVVRQIADTTKDGFRRVIVTTHFGDSTSVGTEYWLHKDGKFFRTGFPSLTEYSYPLFVSSLKSDSSYSSPYVYDVVTWHLTTTGFAGEVFASQVVAESGGMHPISFMTNTGVAQSIGLYYIFTYYKGGVIITQNDTCRLVGLFASGVAYGDTTATMTGVHSDSRSSPEFAVMQNYPNPFNASTTLRYTVAGTGHEALGTSWVKLAVYDILGREVAVLVNDKLEAGFHEVRFNGEGLSSGVYFYRLQAGAYVETKKFVLAK
jgi:hypothetical protein